MPTCISMSYLVIFVYVVTEIKITIMTQRLWNKTNCLHLCEPVLLSVLLESRKCCKSLIAPEGRSCCASIMCNKKWTYYIYICIYDESYTLCVLRRMCVCHKIPLLETFPRPRMRKSCHFDTDIKTNNTNL